MKHIASRNLCAAWDEWHPVSFAIWDVSKLVCPRSANASVFIRTMLSPSTFPSATRAISNLSVVCAIMSPTLVNVVSKHYNFRSLPLVRRSRRPQISGFPFDAISRLEFIGYEDTHDCPANTALHITLLSYYIPFMGKHEPNKLTCSQLCDFIAQLVRALHRHRRGHGFESR